MLHSDFIKVISVVLFIISAKLCAQPSTTSAFNRLPDQLHAYRDMIWHFPASVYRDTLLHAVYGTKELKDVSAKLIASLEEQINEVKPMSRDEAWAQYMMARLYEADGYRKSAMLHYQVADSICVAKRYTDNMCIGAKAFKARVEIYYRLETAKTTLEELRNIAYEREDTALLHKCHLLQAKCDYSFRDYHKAKERSEVSLNYFKKNNHQEFYLEALDQLITAQLALRETKNCKVLIDTLLRLGEENEYNDVLFKSYINLSDYYIAKSSDDSVKWALLKAREYWGEDRNLFNQTILTKKESFLAERLGDYVWANRATINWYEAVLELKDLDVQDASALQRALWEQRAKQLQLDLTRQRFWVVIGFLISAIFIIGTLMYQYRLQRSSTKKLKELDSLKSRLLTDISHEFRTPLSLIDAPLQLIREQESLSETGRHSLHTMQYSVDKLTHLVDNLTDLTRLTEANETLKVSQQDFFDHCSLMFHQFTTIAESSGKNLIVDIEKTSTTTWYNKELVETIVYNLLSNACKHTPEGTTIKALANVENEHAIIMISDNGPGIAKKDKHKIFDRFYRVYRPDVSTEGLGVGLALVQKAVSIHKAVLEVESEPNKGTTFTLTLPISSSLYTSNELTEWSIDESHDTSQEVAESDDQRVMILIIEDNEALNQLLSSVFDKSQYIILQASNGQMGVEMAQQYIPDIIITDLMMPEISGKEVCRQLKSDMHTSHIPIIVLTAVTLKAEKLEVLDLGASDFVTKPFQVEEVRLKVRNQLQILDQLRARYLADEDLSEQKISNHPLDDQFWAQVEDVLSVKLVDANFTVEDFSKAMYMSRMQLHRKLKALSGLSASAFIRSRRLTYGARLIKEEGYTVTEAAFTSGFSSPSYFSTCFKEAYGMSPKDYNLKSS